jgi:hypothetical protein
MTAEPWPSDEKPSSLRVAVATLLVSYWVTRTFRDVYAAAVDTLFICVIKSEDQVRTSTWTPTPNPNPNPHPTPNPHRHLYAALKAPQ